MLLVNSQDDPLVPEELLETPKKYVNSMYDYTIVVELQDDNKLLEQLVTSPLNSTTLYTRKNLTTCQQDVFATGL